MKLITHENVDESKIVRIYWEQTQKKLIYKISSLLFNSNYIILLNDMEMKRVSTLRKI